MIIIQELTFLVTSLHGKTNPTQSSKQSEIIPKPSENKPDFMDIDKDSNERKYPHTPRPVHNKTRSTTNIE